MVSTRRSLAVLLVAMLLCGYVPASGIAATTVGDGDVLDTGDRGDTAGAEMMGDGIADPSSEDTPADAEGDAAESLEFEASDIPEDVENETEDTTDEGPDSVSDLAERLDRDPSTVTHHLDRLAEDGIVERERDGRAVVNKLADSARIAMADDDAPTAAREPVPSGSD